eukprot:178028_1
MASSLNSPPTRFISMAASSLDNSIISTHQEKAYLIDPHSMIQFEENMNALGNEFEKARHKLAFSTTSLQTQAPQLPNITATPLPNTTAPLPISSTEYQSISCIGSTIDKRLQNLRAKLLELQQKDQENGTVAKQNIYKKNTIHKQPQDTAISCPLPILSEKTLNTSQISFAQKYDKYMRKYHGETYGSKRHSLPQYKTHRNGQQARDNAHHLLSKIQQKSKALFATDMDMHRHTANETPYVMNDDHKYDNKARTLAHIDEQLNATWTKTELQLNKIKKMNQHFKQNALKSVSQSVASSHWTLDSQVAQSMHIPSLNTVKEASVTHSHDVHHSFFTATSYNGDEEKRQTEKRNRNGLQLYTQNTKERQDPKEVINLSFNRGIQVTVPLLCSQCKRCLDREDIAVVRVENKQSNGVLSRSSSSSLIQDKVETGTTMSESDRKQLIMDLKSIDGDNHKQSNHIMRHSDCHSDGVLLDERRDTQNKTHQRHSLRAKLNDLKMSMNTPRTYNS